MMIHRCDICKKKIDRDESVYVRVDWHNHEMCRICAKPVLTFLKKNKLVKKNEKE